MKLRSVRISIVWRYQGWVKNSIGSYRCCTLLNETEKSEDKYCLEVPGVGYKLNSIGSYRCCTLLNETEKSEDKYFLEVPGVH